MKLQRYFVKLHSEFMLKVDKLELQLPRIAAIGTCFCLLAALLGPFGTYTTMTFSTRLLFWAGDCLVLSGVSLGFVILLQRTCPALSFWQTITTAAFLSALPGALFITWFYPLLAGTHTEQAALYLVMLEVFFITLFVLWVHFKVPESMPEIIGQFRSQFRGPPSPAAAKPAPAARLSENPQGAPIFQHLPHNLRSAKLVSISMEDHYAKITTTAGEHLKLMRFSDALDLLGGIDGAQIHRSHWVARSAVHSLEKLGRKYELVLTDGQRLPVSTTYLQAAQSLTET